MSGVTPPVANEPTLTTQRGLDHIKDNLVEPWDAYLYEYYLGACEQLFKEKANPLYVWEAISHLGRLRERAPQLVLPPWCMDYLIASAGRVRELIASATTDASAAMADLPHALGLNAGKGANYIASMRSDQAAKAIAKDYARLRKDGVTASDAWDRLAVEQAAKASSALSARLAESEDVTIGVRSVQRQVARGRLAAKLSEDE